MTTSQDGSDEKSYIPKIGDWVQWESQGILRMPAAKKLISFSPNGEFAFVDGSNGTGIPARELIAADPPESEPERPQHIFTPSVMKPTVVTGSAKMQTETFSLPEGVTGQLQWPVIIGQEAFEDFEYQLEGLKKRVRRAVRQSEATETDVPSKSEG